MSEECFGKERVNDDERQAEESSGRDVECKRRFRSAERRGRRRLCGKS